MRVNKTIKIRWREKIIKEGIKKENNLDRQIGEQMNMHVLLTYLKNSVRKICHKRDRKQKKKLRCFNSCRDFESKRVHRLIS